MPALDLAPPPEGAYSTYDLLFSTVQNHAKEHGFAVAVGRSKRDRDGTIRTRYIQCVKSGRPRDRVTDRKKPLISQKTECPFRCRAHLTSSTSGETQWELSVTTSTHNHDPNNPAAHHQHRNLPSLVRDQVAAMTRAGISPKEIASSLNIEHPDLTWTIQDIYNLRRELKAELLEGRSPIEAMVHELENNKFEFNYQLDLDSHITSLFFAHPESLFLLKQYPEVLLMDCTYKTNRFHMPLLDIIGSTSLNHTFFVAFVFLSGETEEDYSYALKMLKKVLDIRETSYPGVIVTDKDQGLMNAIDSVFPQSHNLLCSWHINKNVLSYSRGLKLFERESDEEKSFLAQWNSLVSSATEAEYERRWIEFQMKWRKAPQLLKYLAKTWLDNHKERFVHCWADRYLHFGHRATSRAEGAHSVIKRYLQVSTGDLYSVLEKLSLMLAAQHREHQAAMDKARNRVPQSFRCTLFNTLIGYITPYALWRAYDQKQLLDRPTLHHQCQRSYMNSMGIPCYHIIRDRIAQNQVLYRHDFHPRWFFNRPLESFIQIALRPILNPIVVQTKGRPRKLQQPKSSTAREPSRFEQGPPAAKNSAKTRRKARKQTRTGQQRELEESDEYHDSSEDALMERETRRLLESQGEADPLWTMEPDLAGMTRATRSYALRARKEGEEG